MYALSCNSVRRYRNSNTCNKQSRFRISTSDRTSHSCVRHGRTDSSQREPIQLGGEHRASHISTVAPAGCSRPHPGRATAAHLRCRTSTSSAGECTQSSGRFNTRERAGTCGPAHSPPPASAPRALSRCLTIDVYTLEPNDHSLPHKTHLSPLSSICPLKGHITLATFKCITMHLATPIWSENITLTFSL